jgi:hypothetical protein
MNSLGTSVLGPLPVSGADKILHEVQSMMNYPNFKNIPLLDQDIIQAMFLFRSRGLSRDQIETTMLNVKRGRERSLDISKPAGIRQFNEQKAYAIHVTAMAYARLTTPNLESLEQVYRRQEGVAQSQPQPPLDANGRPITVGTVNKDKEPRFTMADVKELLAACQKEQKRIKTNTRRVGKTKNVTKSK